MQTMFDDGGREKMVKGPTSLLVSSHGRNCILFSGGVQVVGLVVSKLIRFSVKCNNTYILLKERSFMNCNVKHGLHICTLRCVHVCLCNP